MIIDKRQRYTLDVDAAIRALSNGAGIWGISEITFRNTWENYNKGIYMVQLSAKGESITKRVFLK